jgi:hypothetical protein
LAVLYADASALAKAADGARAAGGAPDESRNERRRVARELQSRVLRLYRAIEASTGPLTADQRSQLDYFKAFMKTMR